MTIHSVFLHTSSGLILVEFISNPSIIDGCNHSKTGNSSLLQIKETMAVKQRCFAVSKQVNSDTYTNSHTNMHLSRTQEDEVLLKLLSDPQSEMDAGIKKKKRKGHVERPRTSQRSYSPVTHSHTLCLSPSRRGRDTSGCAAAPRCPPLFMTG